MTKRSPTWTTEETVSLIQLYAEMVRLQQAGNLGQRRGQTSKAALVRDWISTFSLRDADGGPVRSRGSVESKLMNISHVRQEAGYPIVDGYKPASNASKDLKAFYQRSAN